MSAEELDTAAIRARADAASDEVASLCENRGSWHWSIPAKQSDSDLVLASTIRDANAAADEVDRLRKVIEDAPHAHACQINWTSRENEVCDCWKASAVGTNNKEGN
jgi:hypothetical protein